MNYPTTPDGRYFVVRGRLWRCSDPSLPETRRQALVSALMAARRGVKQARHDDDAQALRAARADVDSAKVALGERGPVWWDDGSPDYNRHLVRNSPYAHWHASLETASTRTDEGAGHGPAASAPDHQGAVSSAPDAPGHPQ